MYVTLGSVLGHQPGAIDLSRAALDGVARVLMTIGRATDAAALGAIPQNTRVEQWIPQETVLLGRGMVYAEGLANRGELPVRGSYFVFMPLKIAESSGGNGRALAYIPKST